MINVEYMDSDYNILNFTQRPIDNLTIVDTENAEVERTIMANIKSAKKRIKVIDKKTARNRRVKDHLKSVLKSFDGALEEKNFELAAEKLTLAEKKLMQAAAKGTINKKSASRKISRLAKRFNAAKAAN